MTPSVDERFASVIRALTEVVLPHLPADASLAQEQVHLSVGHLQILRAQFDETPAFEREEIGDAILLAGELTDAIEGGQATREAIAAIAAVGATADGRDGWAPLREDHSPLRSGKASLWVSVCQDA